MINFPEIKLREIINLLEINLNCNWTKYESLKTVSEERKCPIFFLFLSWEGWVGVCRGWNNELLWKWSLCFVEFLVFWSFEFFEFEYLGVFLSLEFEFLELNFFGVWSLSFGVEMLQWWITLEMKSLRQSFLLQFLTRGQLSITVQDDFDQKLAFKAKLYFSFFEQQRFFSLFWNYYILFHCFKCKQYFSFLEQ